MKLHAEFGGALETSMLYLNSYYFASCSSGRYVSMRQMCTSRTEPFSAVVIS